MAQQQLTPAVFTFTTQPVRVIVRDDEPWFVAADVISALDLDRKALDRLDDDEKGVSSIHTPGGAQAMTIINESGLYSLVLGSRKPEAKPFKKWVTSEVLPAIRKSGRYEAGEPLPAVVRSPRLEAQVGRMAGSIETMAGSVAAVAGHVATLAGGMQTMQTMQTQLNLTAKYIALLERNQSGTRRVTTEIIADAKALRAEGMSHGDIAKLLNISRTSVSLVVRDLNPIAQRERQAAKPTTGEILERWIEREQATLAAKLEGGAS